MARIEWIDTVKILGIYLVVLWHTPLNTPKVVFVLYTFLMASFFFISGVTHKDRTPQKELLSAARSLLVPYVCISFLAWLFNRAPRFIAWTLHNPHEFLNHKDDILSSIIGILNGTTPDIPTYWFVLALFWCRLIYSISSSLVPHTRGKWYYITQVAICTIFVAMSTLLHVSLPYKIGSAIDFYLYFALGAMLKPQIMSIQNANGKGTSLIKITVCQISFAITVMLAMVTCKLDSAGHIAIQYPLLSRLGALMGTLSIVLLSPFIHLPRWTNIFSQNTIIILAFHWTFSNRFVLFIVEKLLPTVNNKALPVPLGIMSALISLGLCIIPILGITHLAPWALGKPKLGVIPTNSGTKQSAK